MTHSLDNPVWHSLATRHETFAERSGSAARFRNDVSEFAAVESVTDSSWADLERLVGPGGELILLRDEIGDAPAGWAVPVRGPGVQMVAGDALSPLIEVETRPLGEADAEAMVDLVALTQPGPFQPRTFELGGYLGHFEGPRLVAMAGERMSLPGYTEISAVCTHPDARGRGLAASLTLAVAAAVGERGDAPILHVGAANTGALRLYERLGFERRRDVEYAQLTAPRHA